MVKVSELFFDVILFTEDIYIGIPTDYSNLVDPEVEEINIT
jgi:hypothetical protein